MVSSIYPQSPQTAIPFVASTQVRLFLAESARAGVLVDDVINTLGLETYQTAIATDGGRISLSDFFRIEGEVARRLDDLTAHLSERKLTYETGAFVTEQVKRATTLSEAIHSLAAYFNMMHAEPYNNVRETARTVTLIIDDAKFPYTIKHDPDMVHFIGDCVLIKVQCLLDSLTGGFAARALRRVSLKRQQPMIGAENDLGHLTFWDVPRTYGQTSYELCFDRDLALTPIQRPSDVDLSAGGIFSRVITYLEARAPRVQAASYTARVMDLIRQDITHQDIIAARLSISVATLRRRLESEAVSFRDLVRKHRMEQAMIMLAKGNSVAQVTERLDYSDIRAFNRAFKSWTGETPATYAKKFAHA